ncbi:MAG: cation:proton antiporter [Archaeoglobi archaeon]|nr:cation:proton antiporter [Archaeoglobi archaeon]
MEIYLLLSVFLGFSALVAYIFEGAGFSRIAGYITTGVLLSLFFAESLKANTEFLNFFSDVAITLLVFEIGREVGIEKIRKMNLTPLIILGFEIFFAFLFALLFGTILKLNFLETLILAAVASFSSTAIVFSLLLDLGLSEKTRREILMVMVLEDIFAILILAILPSLRLGSLDPTQLIRLLSLSILITTILITVGITVIRRVFIRVLEINEPGVAIILGSAFLFAVISRSFGLSPALGAFAAGIALSAHPKNAEIGEYLRPLREMFLIVFFVVLGTEAGMANIVSPLLLLAPIIVFLRFLAFTSANWFTTGKSLEESLKIGFTASCVGEFGMVITYEATRLGLVHAEFLTLSAFSVILGSLISSKLSRNADNYAAKISSAVPSEVKTVVDKISANVSRITEGKASDFVRETFFRILRNVLVLFLTIALGSAFLYISDLLLPTLSIYISIVVLSTIVLTIILTAINTRKHAKELCSIFVREERLGYVLEEVLVGTTSISLLLISFGLALLTSSNFLVAMVNRTYKLDIAQFIVLLVLALFFAVLVIGYIKLKRISL